MKRGDAIKEVARQEGLVVANLGFPSRELYAFADKPAYFYMLGSMGLASSIGLGLALSSSHFVYVIDGDGSILMNMGSLVTIAHHAPDNFCLIIIDNKVYGSTGNQPTYTSQKADLAEIAHSAGNKYVVRVKSVTELCNALARCREQKTIIVAEVEPGNEEVPVIPLEPRAIKERFMKQIKKP